MQTQNLCIRVGTNKDEGLSWTLADVGQSALLNVGMSRLPLKFGEKGFHPLAHRLILFICNLSKDRKFKI